MRLGMIGLGRMGASMARRLLGAGHECVVHDLRPLAMASLQREGAVLAESHADMVRQLSQPRIIWLMVPAAVVDAAIDELAPLLEAGDILVDGGNSFYRDDIRRGQQLSERGIRYVDVGTSGGIAGGERGYCLMVGGAQDAFAHLRPVFAALAPGVDAAPRTPGRPAETSDAEAGFLHCGPCGAGHFVKMVHNGIEYGMMAAYAEGLNILRHSNVGLQALAQDAETAPLRHPEAFQYEMNLPQIAEVWRRGSVIGSWLLDLTAAALAEDPELKGYAGHVSDSGEGRWTVQAAIDASVPAPVLSLALYQRFASRGEGDFSNRVLSALRRGFGGHAEASRT